MKRNKFSLSQYKLLTCDLGQLVPCSLTEVLPGDSFQGNTAALIRTTPLVAPVMHPIQVRIHHWFVPTRLLFTGWEDFITGGNDGLGEGTTMPTITAHASTGFAEGSVPDFLGCPVAINSLEVCALPIRAYNMIFNEFYRDQDLVTAVVEDSEIIQRCAWEKDYFTASRPWPQRGPAVTLPLGTKAPVYGIGAGNQSYPITNQDVYEADGSALTTYAKARSVQSTSQGFMEEDPGNTGFPNIFADLTQATAASVNDIREAFALQRYQEARSRYGARYTEYLRYCGVVPSDARLQRPEYLGGGKSTISFSEVLQTSEDGTTPLGTLGGHGITAMQSKKFMRYFTEHGYVMTLMSARPKSIYADGLERHWNRRTKEDYFQKELQHVGQQAIENREIYAQGLAADLLTFGYQDRYSEYRKSNSTIASEFRSNTFDDWHLARLFSSLPVLNQSFTDCDAGDRIFATTTVNNLQIMVQNTLKARRLVAQTQQNRIY